MSKILITSALPYVNNIPHLGNLIGSTLSADVFARHKRLQGNDVLFVCGADEHGTATETKAKEEGVSPQELCDRYEKVHKRIYDWFHISFDIWGRTHTKTHEKITQEIFLDLYENGFILEKEVEQLYDQEAKKFLADRFVEGVCPHCGEEGARGDQCDSCQQLINAVELINPVSKLTGSMPVVKKSNHLFLDLPKLKKQLTSWLESAKDSWPKNTQKIAESWLADLKERAITRDLKWGVPVPAPGFEDKVFYVWFDAVIGYISITAHDKDDWQGWWKSDDVTLFQFMGKDNVVFHSIIFPSMLLGTKKPWVLVDTISAAEFLNMEKGKFSKSKKQGVFGDDAIAIEKEFDIPADIWRYYLLSIRPEQGDSVFSWQEFQDRTNNELLANFGNLAHRTLHFAFTKCKDVTKAEVDTTFIDACKQKAQNVIDLLDKAHLRQALQEIMAIAKSANQYFQEQAPWKSIKEDPPQAHKTILTLLSVVKDLSILLSPYLPQKTQYLQSLLGVSSAGYHAIGTPLSVEVFAKLEEPQVLVQKIEDETRKTLQERFSAGLQSPIDLRVAKILQAKQHPNADRLLVLQLDVGGIKRQLVAGLAGHYTLDELIGKHIVIVFNLEHAVLRGEKSQGMLLAGDRDGDVGLLLAPDTKPGTRLTIGALHGSDKKLPFKEFQKLSLEASKSGVNVNGKPVTGADFVVDKEVYGKLR